ncbi:hypothetical protein HYQ45_017005 [Verticillium longisporum]|uniref:MAGE domain-containing protein n=1 Tax=Verticillium longisporum TaxID=100787 RepID=A0A8I2Z779_VERLO|nr:hypothetical protein HYQ45_017005 [Verticillium longisporum]
MPAGSRRRREVDNDADDDQRPRQRRTRDSSAHEDADADEAADADDEDGADVSRIDAAPTADQQLAKKLIRYAMACDYARQPIRRDGIKERVLGDQGRAFRRVFDAAQGMLRDVWGMELRELPMREKHSLEEKRRAIKAQSQAKTSSGIYVLSSTLPPAYRAAAIMSPSKTPDAEAEAAYVAFYTLITTIILLSGGELSDAKLRRHLHRLNAEDNVGTEPTEDVLKRMQAQGYVVKLVQRDVATQAKDALENTTWYVGPRAHEEVGPDGASGLVRRVWGPQEGDQATDELERKIRASFRIREAAAAAAATVAAAEGDDEATPAVDMSGADGGRHA